jgi:hypothetical protein
MIVVYTTFNLSHCFLISSLTPALHSRVEDTLEYNLTFLRPVRVFLSLAVYPEGAIIILALRSTKGAP